MPIEFIEHALIRAKERNITEKEIIAAVKTGNKLPGKFGRIRFEKIFAINKEIKGIVYSKKLVIVIAELRNGTLTVISVISKFIK